MKGNVRCIITTVVFLPLAMLAQASWVYRYNGLGNYWDEAFSVVYGADGNVYAAGVSAGSDTNFDFMVISLTTAGDTNWLYQYNGPGNEYDNANSIVYGADGNLCGAGASTGSGTSFDFTVISLTTAGDTNWVYRYDGPANSYDGVNAIAYGANGNIYAAGFSYGSGTNTDFTVVSLTTAGDTNWVWRYNGQGNEYDEAYSIVYGDDGNIYAAGTSCGSGTSADFTVISLTTAGETNWIYRYDGPIHDQDFAYSIAYGADGNLYAAGYSVGSGTSSDFTVISLTTAGDTNWVYRYNGPGNGWDQANSIVYGADGNLYAAGHSYGSGTYGDFTVISLTTDGDTNWLYQYNGPGNEYDNANSIVYGADGNLYAAGGSSNGGPFYDHDFTVISLTTEGDTNWVYRYNGPGNDYDEANSIIYGADGNLYAAGASTGSGTSFDFTVISLPPDLGVEEKITSKLNVTYCTTIFSGPLVLPKGKQFKVFDITGRTVTPDKLTPGVYFIEVDEQIVHKVIKVK